MDSRKYNYIWLVLGGVSISVYFIKIIARGFGKLDYNDEKQFDIAGINE